MQSSEFRDRNWPRNGSVTLVWRTNPIGKTDQLAKHRYLPSVLSQKLSQFAGPNRTSLALARFGNPQCHARAAEVWPRGG